MCTGKTIYVIGIDLEKERFVYGRSPCYRCQSRIINVGLENIVYMDWEYNIIRIKVGNIIKERKENPFAKSEKELELLKKED